MSSIDFKTLSNQVESALNKGEGSKLNINIYKNINLKKLTVIDLIEELKLNLSEYALSKLDLSKYEVIDDTDEYISINLVKIK